MPVLPVPAQGTDADVAGRLGKPWIVIVWDDPINLMSYVTYVFQSYFGFARPKAERLMLAVHTQGQAVVASGPREQAEMHVEAMHSYGLWATLEQSDG
jgi:ATP-dependent Clp protease adaptor protein ClpS